MPPCKKHKGKIKTNAEKRTIYEEVPQIFMSRQASAIGPIQESIRPLSFVGSEIQRSNLYQKMTAPNLTTSVIMKKEKVDFIKKKFIKQINVTIQKNFAQVYEIKEQEILLNENDEVMMDDLINQLKNNGQLSNGFFDNTLISVQNQEESNNYNSIPGLTPNLLVYTQLGRDPLENCKIKLPDVNSNSITIKVTSTKSNLLDQLLGEQSEYGDVKQKKDKQERLISEVVEKVKVALWRRLYTGFYDQNKTFIQMPLNEAALKVNIAKKTLDDYLLQIRCGKRYGFDFNTNRSEKIGKLRSYVKDSKKMKKN